MARLGTNEVIVDIDCDEIRELTWIKTCQHHIKCFLSNFIWDVFSPL